MSIEYFTRTNRQILKTINETDVDILKSLEERRAGISCNSKRNISSHDLQVHAEDVFVKKKFDELRCEMPGTSRSTFLMVFSPDGSKVASTHGNHNIHVTDVRTGKNIKTLVGHPRTPWCIAFHPTSNQILASGCLGGQVRIWDLSGGSEVWTSEIPTVIASIAFHPDDRLLVIATYNELYFWDWSKPEPFMHVATGNIKEKVRYVAFDKLGHKLITGISNSPQTRWERVRAPVPVPRQVDRSASPYRRRITPRLISNIPETTSPVQPPSNIRDPLPTVPERERRITACYRNLVREYELLVHRYLQIYRPPTMIDQGTDPMEIELNTITGSNTPQPSTSGTQANNLQGSSATEATNTSSTSTSHIDSSPSSTVRTNLSSPIRPSPRRVAFDLNAEIMLSQNSPPYSGNRFNDSSSNAYSNHSGDQSRPIDLSTSPTAAGAAASPPPTNGTTAPSDDFISSELEIASLYESGNSAERDVVVITPSDICSLRRSARNIRGTQTQETESSGGGGGTESSSVNLYGRHERRNSAPAGTTATNVLQREQNNDVELRPSTSNFGQSATTSGGGTTSNFLSEKVRRLAQLIYKRQNANSSSARGARTSEPEPQPVPSINDQPQQQESARSSGIGTGKRYTDFLKELKNISFNINRVSDSIKQLQSRENRLGSNNDNNADETISQERDSRTIQSDTAPSTSNYSEPRPSTSNTYIRPIPLDDSHLNYKFYEHTRKRLYSGLLKKNRRPIIDSSSDSSSSEDDGVTTKRLCTPKAPLTANTAANITNIANSPKVDAPGQTSIGPVSPDRRIRGINFNQELEILVTDLLADNKETTPNTPSCPQNSSAHTSSSSNNNNNQTCPQDGSATGARVCQTCGGNIQNGNLPALEVSTQPTTSTTSTMSNSHACPRSTESTSTRTTNTTIYTSPGSSRINNRPSRFFSHRASAFYPTRIQNLRSYSRLRRNNSYLSPAMRNRLRILNTLHSSNRLPGSFALDEVINYSERVATEEEAQEPQAGGYHPFDPPPEFATINPENIGIGNMYSNIVQELESSLNDVRNIRASNRIGETSDMLSSFSERLESIMNQSNAILRNLRTSIDTLQPSADQNLINFSSNPDPPQQQASPPRLGEPRVSFSDSNFYLREQRNTDSTDANFENAEAPAIERPAAQDDLFSNQNAIASDHTYPLNSRNTPASGNNMTPLMASLHLTVSHIQRQARLLRQQVESIERIDRAMLEIAQLQTMRQMFIEMQCYFRATLSSDSRSAVSSVRQMMAGTRISDSSPYDSPNEESSNENDMSPMEAGPSGANNPGSAQNSTGQSRNQPRKTYPRCIFLMHRNFRRGCVGNILQRRCLSRERMMRRNSFRRAFTYRSLMHRSAVDLSTNRNTNNVSQLSSESLRSITRRLENFLMEHGRNIGRAVESRFNTSLNSKDEYIMMLRLNQCRARILGQDQYNSSVIRRQTSSVTADGSSRYSARDMLTIAIESLSRCVMNNSNVTQSLKLLIWNVVDLSLLLSEILLLQIVDSIPPPSGMNLDPERESLSARIDQMCSRMLQNRLSGHSQQLTRSLRLTRLAVRQASRALDQTYTARRNSMLPTSHNRDQRRELLEEINNCLRNIRRHGSATQYSSERVDANTENLSRTEWYRTIHSLITRYRGSSVLEDAQPSTSGVVNTTNSNNINNSNSINADNGAQTETAQTTDASGSYTQASSDDDNEPYWYNNNNNSPNSSFNTLNATTNISGSDRSRPLYRTNNVNLFNLLNNAESISTTTSGNRPFNVPTVQVNDVPISQYQSPWHPRFLANRQRLSERLSELRTERIGGLFRPRFLHPLQAAGNPFETEFDESVRDQIYDSDIITPVTPNHRIQVWEFSSGIIPNINNALKNVVVNECKIHNDASVDIASNGNFLVTLLPSGGYLNGTNRLGVYSLKWETLGQCLYLTSFEQNAVSVSLSPLSRHLVVGLASRRVSIMPSEKWTMARIFFIENKLKNCKPLLPVREVEQTRDPNYMSVNCIRWLPVSGQGLVYATNTGQLRILT